MSSKHQATAQQSITSFILRDSSPALGKARVHLRYSLVLPGGGSTLSKGGQLVKNFLRLFDESTDAAKVNGNACEVGKRRREQELGNPSTSFDLAPFGAVYAEPVEALRAGRTGRSGQAGINPSH